MIWRILNSHALRKLSRKFRLCWPVVLKKIFKRCHHFFFIISQLSPLWKGFDPLLQQLWFPLLRQKKEDQKSTLDVSSCELNIKIYKIGSSGLFYVFYSFTLTLWYRYYHSLSLWMVTEMYLLFSRLRGPISSFVNLYCDTNSITHYLLKMQYATVLDKHIAVYYLMITVTIIL